MSEQNNTITLYPSNWIYNAGIIGLLNLFEEAKCDISINNEICITDIQKIFNETENIRFNSEVTKRINKWHWIYLNLTYDKYYGNIEAIIKSAFIAASNSTQKAQFLKKILDKDKKYTKHNFSIDDKEIDFSKVYKEVDKIWSDTFRKNAAYKLEDAISKVIEKLEPYKNSIIYRRAIAFLFSTGCIYQNYYNPGWYADGDKFLSYFTMDRILKEDFNRNKLNCDFCYSNRFSTKQIDLKNFADLFPNYGNFANSFWNMDIIQTQNICSFCEFIILHQHLGFIKTTWEGELFINAPSFELMYELNKLLKETYGSKSKEESRGKREILATTVIEYSRKIKSTLGIWTGMNLEIVIKNRNEIEFFSLPFDTIKIISDRRIAAILSDLGEFKILNKILDRKFSDLTEIGYKLLRESTKDYDKRNEKLIKDLLYRWENQRNLSQTATKILKLYSLIEEKQKGVNKYEYSN